MGLEYVRLGQPVPTLSGGEAQRLKLAGHLAEAARSGISTAKVAKKGSLFLFDEPTTGLHFDDVARLMRAFRKPRPPATLLVIEHNLDVIRAADWLIDLPRRRRRRRPGDRRRHAAGPDGQPQVAYRRALRDYETSIPPTPVADVVVSSDIDAQEAEQAGLSARIAEPDAPYGAGVGTPLQSLMRARRQSAMSIEIRTREHNLKNVNVEIPRDKFTVITGVSGSQVHPGLRHPLQRRPAPLPESLNAYARAIVQLAGKPDVDAIFGIPPTVAIEQRTSRGGRKSTVATMTEIHHFLRLLYVKLGTQYCPDCNVAVEPQNTDRSWPACCARAQGEHIGLPGPAGHRAQGLLHRPGQVGRRARPLHLRVDGQFIPVAPWPRLDRYKEHTIELPVADVVVDPANEAELRAAVKSALENGQGVMSVVWPVNKLHEALDSDLQQQHFSVKRACPSCGISFPEPDPRLFSYNSKHGWCTGCFGTGLQLQGLDEEQTGEETAWNAW